MKYRRNFLIIPLAIAFLAVAWIPGAQGIVIPQCPGDTNGDGTVARRMPQRVREEVHEHPLDLLGSERRRDAFVHLRCEPNVAEALLSV